MNLKLDRGTILKYIRVHNGNIDNLQSQLKSLATEFNSWVSNNKISACGVNDFLKDFKRINNDISKEESILEVLIQLNDKCSY